MASKKHHDNVLNIIHKRLIPDEEAKKARGEVFTPLPLVREMLYGLRKSSLLAGKQEVWGVDENGECVEDDPSDRMGGIPIEVWRDPSTKWLDPANGIGNFPVVTFYMLDYQLGKHGPAQYRGEENSHVRRKHIVEKMLFMIELNKGNVNTARKIFRLLVPSAESNVCCADTLKMTDVTLTTVFGENRFEVVMGNPPFQALQEAEGKRGGGDELYMKFVKKVIELLKPDCYLSFVHPPSWRKPEYNEGKKKSKNAGMFDLMAHQNQLIYLEIHDSKDGMRVFKAGTRYDFYLLKKTHATDKTIIKDLLGEVNEIDLNDFDFLPNYNITNVLKLFPTKEDPLCELGKFDVHRGKYHNDPCVLFERSAYVSDKVVSATKSSQYKYPLVHTTPQGGPIFKYSSINDKGMFGVPKVIFGDSGINDPVIDLKGQYGMTQHAMALVVAGEEDAVKLKEFIKSNFFKNVLHACMYSGFQIDWRLFTYFKQNFWNTDVELNEPLMVVRDKHERNVSIKAKKPKAPAHASGGAGEPPPRRSPYSSRTRRAPRRV